MRKEKICLINKIKVHLFFVTIICLFSVYSFSCHNNGTHNEEGLTQDTLRVVTLYGPTSYFIYQGEELGYDFENIRKFAEDEGMVLELHVANSMTNLLEDLKTGKSDIAAYPVPKIGEYNDMVIHCGPIEITTQVLVQPVVENKKIIDDVTDLIGKTIWVENKSKYHYRLLNLNEELGGGIIIHPVSNDSIDAEDLLVMVAEGKIPLTIVDSDIASLNKSYYPNIDVSLKVSLDQASSWAVSINNDSLARILNIWEKKYGESELGKKIYKKYFEISKNENLLENHDILAEIKLKRGSSLSPYDSHFKKYAPLSGFDWQLLASIGYNESRFNNSAESRFGAVGVMQLMPSTANSLGFSSESLQNPESNINAAAKLLNILDKSLSLKVEDPEERIKFVVAAYNSGLGHIYDAIALADKYGLNSQKWFGSVRETALLKSKPEYFTDPLVKNGYFRGRETVEFVDNVMKVYNYYKSKTE